VQATGSTVSGTPTGVAGIIYTVGSILLVIVWIYTIVQTIRLRRWGWLVGVILLSVYAAMAFAIFGPTTRREPAPAAVATP
jgi:hypothetical protein